MTPTLPAHEQIVLDRLKIANPFGWQPEGRSPEGVAIMRADHEVPGMPGYTRISRVALTEAGMVSLGTVHRDPEGNAVKLPPVRIRRPVVKEKAAVHAHGPAGDVTIHCPHDGALMVRDNGWYRCPTEKCKVVV